MEACAEDVIIEISSNEYKSIISVTKSTIRKLATAGDILKKRIQDETKTTITWSKSKSKGSSKRFIEIKGAEHENVYLARQQIKSLKNESKSNDQPTHFTCVRITDSAIVENFLKFKADVLRDNSDMMDSIFMKSEKLHLTIGVMRLHNAEILGSAEQALIDCMERVIKPVKNEFDSIQMQIQGAEIMKGSPGAARVVHAKIQSEALQKIANGIANHFIATGLAKKETGRDIVKLHMTLLNVKYSKGKHKSFDASDILEKYAHFNFGTQEVNRIDLVSMQQTDPDGFYKSIATIHF